ncbi:hypothetical protein, partial [Klebsiella pneumoniae]|uniref:hypothetical protein n=1 Tax=Klebsiella pneumoniae TaxID=573 RepID=UPI0007A3C941
MTVSIVSPSAAAVKPRRHPRFRREDIPAPEIDPVLKAFGRHIARSFHRGRGVHGTVAKLAMRQPFVLFKGLT